MSATPPLTPVIHLPISGRAVIAERILRSLPQWFGRRDATANYVAIAAREPMIAASLAGTNIGFPTLTRRVLPFEGEIAVMGVEPEYRRMGVGRRLIEAAVMHRHANGVTSLFVQTLGASHPDQAYAGTRAFYRAVGFSDVSETPDAWRPGTPALLLHRPIRGSNRP